MKELYPFENFEKNFRESILANTTNNNIENIIKASIRESGLCKPRKFRTSAVAVILILVIISFPAVLVANTTGIIHLFDKYGNASIIVKGLDKPRPEYNKASKEEVNQIEEALKKLLQPDEIIQYFITSEFRSSKSYRIINQPLTFNYYKDFEKLYIDSFTAPPTLLDNYKFENAKVFLWSKDIHAADLDALFDEAEKENKQYAYIKYNAESTYPQTTEITYANGNNQRFIITISKDKGRVTEYSHFNNSTFTKVKVGEIEGIYSYDADNAMWRYNDATYEIMNFNLSEDDLINIISSISN